MMNLDELLEDASQRRVAFTPDVESLLRAGRRRHRGRVALAAAAAVAVVAGGSVALLGGRDGAGLPTPLDSLPAASSSVGRATAPAVSAADVRILRECGKQYDNTSEEPATPRSPGSSVTTGPPSSPKGYDFSRWSVAVSATDSSGTSAALLSPDRKKYAICAFSPPQWTGGGDSGVDVFDVRAVAVPHGWRDGFAPINWAYDCNLKRNDSCEHEVWAGAALLPRAVSRVTIRTRDGVTGDAVVRNGYLAFRHLAPYKAIRGEEQQGSGAGTMPPVIITLYNSAGKRLASFNQNYLPPIPSNCPSTGGC